LLPGTAGAILARMRIRVKRASDALKVVALALSVPWQAAAEAVAADEADRWVPALTFDAGFVLQDVEASIESGDVLGPGFPNPFLPSQQPIRPAASGDTLMFTPDVRVGLDLLTPRVTSDWWAPRFFVRASVGGALGPSYDVAKEGAIGKLSAGENIVTLTSDEVDGQGSRIRARLQSPVVRAGAGLGFTVDALGRRFRVRTSVEYLREVIEVEGAVRRAVCNVRNNASPATKCGAQGSNRGGGVDDFRVINLRRSESQDFHGIGPGLEVETDVGRAGPIVPSIHIGAQAFRFLGNRKVSFSTSNEYGETASASFEKDAWAYGVGVGLRLRWLPK